MSDDDQRSENSEESVPIISISKKNFIVGCCKDGLFLVLSCLLNDVNDKYLRDVIEMELEEPGRETLTLLMIAARHGHEKVVRLLLNTFSADPNHCGTVRMDHMVIEKCSPLWCAAGLGHINVVKALVEAGADIDHETETGSTAIRAACFEGRLDIIQYLVDHGGSIHCANKFNNTCLMLASFRGSYDVACYMLDQGMDPNEVSNCGSSALIYASQAGHLEIVKLLLQRGAVIVPTPKGLSPLMAAAEQTKSDVVDYFIEETNISKIEKIDAFELLGASFANDKDNYSLEKAFYYMMKGMQLRYSDRFNVIKKPDVYPIPAYGNRIECQTVEELGLIRNSEDCIHMEALCVRERILGQFNPELAHHILYRGAVFADTARFDRCLDLWLHGLLICRNNGLPINKDLLRIGQVFCHLMRHGIDFDYYQLQEVLRISTIQLEVANAQYKYAGVSEDLADLKEEDHVLRANVEQCMLVALYFLAMMVRILPFRGSDDRQFIHELVLKLNNSDAVTRSGKSLLHLAVDPDTPTDQLNTMGIISFPCELTTNILLECGAEVNALDYERNTPLHLISSYNNPLRDFKTLHTIIMDLTSHGAHIDIMNCQGKIPIEAADSAIAEIILQTQTKPSLKCLAARVTRKYNIPYEGQIPKTLETFVELHGPAKASSAAIPKIYLN